MSSSSIKVLTAIAVDWGLRCFGVDHMRNRRLRALRFLEEAIELAQSCGLDEAKAQECVKQVFARTRGDHFQEVGGCMVTLTVLCNTIDVDPEYAFECEVRRCLSKSPKEFADRNQQKLEAGLT